MPRSTSAHRLLLALITVGLMGTLATAQRPPADPLAEARARQAVADQKATIEVMGVIATAERQAKANPGKAVRTLKAAQVIVDSPILSTDTRKSLLDLISRKIAAVEGRAVADASPSADPKGAAIKYDRQAAYESAVSELRSVNDGIRKMARYQDAGLTREAERELALLTRNYPNNPSVIMLQQKDSFASNVRAAEEFNDIMSKRVNIALRNVDESAKPAIMDVEFPKDWKEKTERRLTGIKLSEKEKKIIEALDRPITVNWNNLMLEEALQELSTKMDQNLFIDKKSLSDLGIELNKPTSLQANGVSTRTVLRQILAAQGLTFVVKDEAIQVVTVEKARDMLVTRVYYLGDLVQATGPFGGAPQWGTFLDFQQTMANVDTIVKSITSSIDPLSWKERGGPGTVTFHYPSMSIIVRASAEVHASLSSKMGGGR
jgi:hypothetical protein